MNISKIITLLLFTAFATVVKGDQLAYIDKNSAIKATEFLNNNKEAILFCGCCQGDVKKKISIYSAKYSRVPEVPNYYKVSISYEYNGDSMAGFEDIDLAYIHTQNDGVWFSVGRALGMECDPCVEPFVFEMNTNRGEEQINTNNELIDWTGKYVDKFNNVLTIVGPTKSGEVKFTFSDRSSASCQELSLKGIALLYRIYVANYQEEGSQCHLNFSWGGDEIEVREYDCDHGASCGDYNGVYVKRK
jgi:hypothetical protein